ncbi:MAG: TrmH family RNA methyltransferase, partial [Flavihumibacter sp.]
MITKKQVKYIQSLSQKKLRDSEKQFVAEGPKVVDELLAAGNLQPVAVYATAEWIEKRPAGSLPVQEISTADLERISFLTTANQVLAVFEKPVPLAATGSWQLLLDGIQDPGNLGTIIRIADWFGISTVVCSPDTADVFAPKVVQSTMASIAR